MIRVFTENKNLLNTISRVLTSGNYKFDKIKDIEEIKKEDILIIIDCETKSFSDIDLFNLDLKNVICLTRKAEIIESANEKKYFSIRKPFSTNSLKDLDEFIAKSNGTYIEDVKSDSLEEIFKEDIERINKEKENASKAKEETKDIEKDIVKTVVVENVINNVDKPTTLDEKKIVSNETIKPTTVKSSKSSNDLLDFLDKFEDDLDSIPNKNENKKQNNSNSNMELNEQSKKLAGLKPNQKSFFEYIQEENTRDDKAETVEDFKEKIGLNELKETREIIESNPTLYIPPRLYEADKVLQKYRLKELKKKYKDDKIAKQKLIEIRKAETEFVKNLDSTNYKNNSSVKVNNNESKKEEIVERPVKKQEQIVHQPKKKEDILDKMREDRMNNNLASTIYNDKDNPNGINLGIGGVNSLPRQNLINENEQRRQSKVDNLQKQTKDRNYDIKLPRHLREPDNDEMDDTEEDKPKGIFKLFKKK